MDKNRNKIERSMDFEELVSRYSLLITKICYYFAINRAEMDDLRQEILLNIWKGWSNFRMESQISTWIYRVCFNTCITFVRKNKHRKDEVPLSQFVEIEDEVFDLGKYQEMHRLINLLNGEEKAIIMMWLDEKSYDEIAYVVGLNRNTVASRIKRIKEKLVKMSNA